MKYICIISLFFMISIYIFIPSIKFVLNEIFFLLDHCFIHCIFRFIKIFLFNQKNFSFNKKYCYHIYFFNQEKQFFYYMNFSFITFLVSISGFLFVFTKVYLYLQKSEFYIQYQYANRKAHEDEKKAAKRNIRTLCGESQVNIEHS